MLFIHENMINTFNIYDFLLTRKLPRNFLLVFKMYPANFMIVIIFIEISYFLTQLLNAGPEYSLKEPWVYISN